MHWNMLACSVLLMLQTAGSAALSQVAAKPAAGPPPLPELGDAEVMGKIGGALPKRDPTSSEVVFLRLRGPFTEGGIQGDCISPFAMQLMLGVCKQRKPDAIVLDIESPGGLVVAMDDIVEQLLEAQTASRLRIVAWPRNAHSAAAITCLTCKELVVRPISRVGAATKVIGTEAAPKAETAMDQKFESSRQARRRTIADTTGRDILILDAMEHPERQLWFRTGSGFRDSPQAGEGWVGLDKSKDAPATLNAEELITTGVAVGSATTEAEVVKLLKLAPTATMCSIDLADPKIVAALRPTIDALDAWLDWRDKRVKSFEELVRQKVKAFHAVVTKLEAMESGDGWSDEDQELLERQIRNLALLPKIDPALEEVMQGTGWLDCKTWAFDAAKDSAELALVKARPQKAGTSKTVDLSSAKELVVDSGNYLVSFLNGCE